MPAGATSLVVDQATLTIRLERRFAAPAAQVFQAWTRPDQVANWWDPTGEPLATCEIDLRPGGAFNFVPKGHPPFAGQYREIAPPNRLVFEALGAIGRVVIHEDSAGTLLSVEIQCASVEHLQQFLQNKVDEGTSQTLDRLVAYLGAPATV